MEAGPEIRVAVASLIEGATRVVDTDGAFWPRSVGTSWLVRAAKGVEIDDPGEA